LWIRQFGRLKAVDRNTPFGISERLWTPRPRGLAFADPIPRPTPHCGHFGWRPECLKVSFQTMFLPFREGFLSFKRARTTLRSISTRWETLLDHSANGRLYFESRTRPILFRPKPTRDLALIRFTGRIGDLFWGGPFLVVFLGKPSKPQRLGADAPSARRSTMSSNLLAALRRDGAWAFLRFTRQTWAANMSVWGLTYRLTSQRRLWMRRHSNTSAHWATCTITASPAEGAARIMILPGTVTAFDI